MNNICRVNNYSHTGFSFDKSLLENPLLKGNGVTLSLTQYEYNNVGDLRSQKLIRRFITLQNTLQNELGGHIDPIEYMIQLYYGEGLSVEDIFKRLNKKGLNYSENGIRPYSVLMNLFHRTFKWKLRDRSIRSEIGEKKRQASEEFRTNMLLEKNKRTLEETKNLVSDTISILLSKRNQDVVLSTKEEDDFLDAPNHKKVLILLDKFYSLNRNNIINLNRAHFIGYKRLEKIIGELIYNLPREYSDFVKVNERMIRNLINLKN
ncbi:MAG: hypothetical protein PHN31_01210 [Candidatus Gracilibacteria bacterium]|nr:hypothetical protein [Candidatus Gracilibacteria bacterium]